LIDLQRRSSAISLSEVALRVTASGRTGIEIARQRCAIKPWRQAQIDSNSFDPRAASHAHPAISRGEQSRIWR
jgi:hypothetical protein